MFSRVYFPSVPHALFFVHLNLKITQITSSSVFKEYFHSEMKFTTACLLYTNRLKQKLFLKDLTIYCIQKIIIKRTI